MTAGWSTKLSQPPNEGAMYGIFRESTKFSADIKPPATCISHQFSTQVEAYVSKINFQLDGMEYLKLKEIHLKTDYTTKTSHLTLGDVMFWMARQARVVNTYNLAKQH